MLSCCCSCSIKFQSPRTEHLSSPPLLASLHSESSSLLPCILLFLLHTASSDLSSHPLIAEVKNIHGDPHIFPATFLSKYLTGYISHYCIVGGNHGVDVYVLIPQTDEWCEFPTYCFLTSACHIWVPPLLNLCLGWFGFFTFFR